ncbi:hypothetical protein [Micromonospora sp. NPDC049102]|uniref:hypothetical protein n=1 Tax=Micromonospora sp. NPDC049102 TaxID=3364265 RepID=UPI0037104254
MDAEVSPPWRPPTRQEVAAAAGLGPQPQRLGPARVWVLPNPSGLNAHFPLPALTAEFARLRREVGP